MAPGHPRQLVEPSSHFGTILENISDDQAGSEEEPLVQSNLERLRSHLKPDSLALALLDAWVKGGQQGAKARLRRVVEERFTIVKSEHDAAD